MRVPVIILSGVWLLLVLPSLIFYNLSNNLPFWQPPALSEGIVVLATIYASPILFLYGVATWLSRRRTR